MTGDEIRKTFLDYFAERGHRIVRSSSLVPADDPTLLFINAGMNQFKRVFLGEEKRDYNRAVTSQKCVRAGGKHNDLENVGYTARHHTFFEMLGNFSFGDYFKEKAVAYAWELLTRQYGLPEAELWVSIYLDDDEAFKIWNEQIGVPAEKIARLGEKDNFWAMGDTGPCGPCSEIHLDRGAQYGCGRPDCSVDCDCDRFLEIWNLVFMQYNRDADGKMLPLPRPSIDTGLGLERMASVLQDVSSNFETDLLRPIIAATENAAQKRFGEKEDIDVAMKVIADHSRAAAFLIGDGILPSNEGRGYVLRRIMRRAIRYGRNIGLTRPFLHETAGVVFDIMKSSYPELAEAHAFITSVIKNEEVRFSETLDYGLRLLNDTLADLRARGETRVPGEVIFKLYDTYGFPVDIVADVVRDEHLTLDMPGFERAMEGQRAQSRSVATFTSLGEAYKNLSARGVRPVFVGYDRLADEAEVLLLVTNDRKVPSAGAGEAVEIVTDRTPFYGAAGGQVGDAGRIVAPADGGDLEITVEDTVKDPTGLIIHKGQVLSGRLQQGDRVRLEVDGSKRAATARNHTATHILHAALREVLGEHVKQAGSLVAPDRLRFDFTHFAQVDAEALESIETRVNAQIRENVPTHTEEMEIDEAFKAGATALFEEKYGDRVRVVSMSDFSKELCGGTHAARTGDVGFFTIISESSVASGVRRIEALTGEAAVAHAQRNAKQLREAATLLKDKPEAVADRLARLLAEHREQEKKITRLEAAAATDSLEDIEQEVRTVDGVRVLAKHVAVDSPAALRELADRFKDRLGSGIVVLGSATESKALLITGVTKDLVGTYHAGRIVKALAAVVGGGGGGRPDMAQAGGPEAGKLEEALARVYEIVAAG